MHACNVPTSGGSVAYDPGKEACHYPYRVLETPILMMYVLLRHLYHSAVAEFVATRQPGCTHDVTSEPLCCSDAVLPSVRQAVEVRCVFSCMTFTELARPDHTYADYPLRVTWTTSAESTADEAAHVSKGYKCS